MDLVFMLPSSNSVGFSDWSYIIDFVSTIVSVLDINSGLVRVGLLKWDIFNHSLAFCFVFIDTFLFIAVIRLCYSNSLRPLFFAPVACILFFIQSNSDFHQPIFSYQHFFTWCDFPKFQLKPYYSDFFEVLLEFLQIMRGRKGCDILLSYHFRYRSYEFFHVILYETVVCNRWLRGTSHQQRVSDVAPMNKWIKFFCDFRKRVNWTVESNVLCV